MHGDRKGSPLLYFGFAGRSTLPLCLPCIDFFAFRSARVNSSSLPLLAANLLIRANIYILFIVRSPAFMRRLFPFDYTFIIATRHSSFLAAGLVGRENILLSRVAKK